jgi:hypothetical protein
MVPVLLLPYVVFNSRFFNLHKYSTLSTCVPAPCQCLWFFCYVVFNSRFFNLHKYSTLSTCVPAPCQCLWFFCYVVFIFTFLQLTQVRYSTLATIVYFPYVCDATRKKHAPTAVRERHTCHTKYKKKLSKMLFEDLNIHSVELVSMEYHVAEWNVYNGWVGAGNTDLM